jgi:hypothetical protein
LLDVLGNIKYYQNITFRTFLTEMLDLWNRLIFATEDMPAGSDYIAYKKQVQKLIQDVFSSLCSDNVDMEYQDILFLKPNLNAHPSKVRDNPY